MPTRKVFGVQVKFFGMRSSKPKPKIKEKRVRVGEILPGKILPVTVSVSVSVKTDILGFRKKYVKQRITPETLRFRVLKVELLARFVCILAYGQNRGSNQFLNWLQQYATGILRLNFQIWLYYHKKTTPNRMVGCCFWSC